MSANATEPESIAAKHRASARIGTVALVAGLIASACASSDGDPMLEGAGASTQTPITTAWMEGFRTETGAELEYVAVGSTTGRELFLAGEVDFAGSDVYLTDEERRMAQTTCAGSLGAVHVPTYLSSIGLVYNLPSLEGEQLNLSADVIAGIYTGDITNWNDPAIASDNPGVDLPDLLIVPVHRYDSSGTTDNFTEYLTVAAPSVWSYGEFSNWSDNGPAGKSAVYSNGTAQVVASAEGSIGYVDVAQASGLPLAAIEAGDGFVAPTDESVTEAFALASTTYSPDTQDLMVEFDRVPDSSSAYPLAMLSYTVVCLQYEDLATANLVGSYLYFVQSDEAQQIASTTAGAVQLNAETTERIQAISESIGAFDSADGPIA
ncbi:MAG: phosphate ABC transporter substrate-binding protein PstS [Actinomycetota bacterium]